MSASKRACAPIGLIAAIGVLAIGSAAIASAETGPGPTASAAKKKCGKKGKKSASIAKRKCGKKKNGAGTTPPSGPQMRVGEYACASAGYIASGMQVLPGNRYTVNRESPGGTYTYNPATKIVTFSGGGFGSFYGVYDETSKVAPFVDIYAAYNDPPVEYGDYYGECGWLSAG